MKKLILAMGAFALLVGGYWYTNQAQKDPLSELLGVVVENQNKFSADYFTDTVLPYDGPISDAIKACMATAPKSANEGIVYAEIDKAEFAKLLEERENGTFDKEVIRASVMPVHGYAMKNSQINWDWNPELYSYTFYVTKGEESFWDCYFDLDSETIFFPRLFGKTWYKTLDFGNSTIKISEDTGVSSSDGITKDNTLVISGVAAANATITIYLDGVMIGTAPSDANGNFSFDYTSIVLPDKSYSIQTTATINGATSEKSQPFTAVIDTSTTKPVINTPTSGAPVSGSAEPGATVVVSTPSGSTCTATADTAGNWNCTLSPSPVDKESVTAIATDKAGNTASTTVENAIDNDITPPPVPKGPADLVDASDTGTNDKDNITNDTTPTFEVYCTEAGNTLTLYVDGVKAGTALCTSDTDKPTITIITPLVDGVHKIEYTDSDNKGNESGKSPILEILIDTKAPTTTPILLSPDAPTSNILSPLVGRCGTDAESGTIEVSTNPENGFTPYPAKGSLDANGNFNIAVTWKEGTYMVILKCYDKAGNGPTTATEGPVVIDASAPSSPANAPDLTDASDTGESHTDNITSDTTPTFTIACEEAPVAVKLYDGIKVIGTGNCTTVGQPIQITASPAMTDGPHDISYTYTDAQGNESGKSPILPVVIDTKAPIEEPNLISPVLPTNNDKAPIVGSCGIDAAGGRVKITSIPENGFTPYPVNTILDGLGNFNVPVTWKEGEWMLSISCYDKAGNGPTTKVEGPVIIDLTPPDITGKKPDLQAASDTGVSNTDDITSDNTPTFDVICTEKDSTITLYIDGVAVEPTVKCTAAGGKIAITPNTPIPDGVHQITYTETDYVGNESSQSLPLAVTIDTTAPTGTPDLTSPTEPTPDKNVPLIGTCGADAAGGKVEITTTPGNGFTPYPAVQSPLDASGNFTIAGLTWTEGSYMLTLKCYDKAGNGPTTKDEGPVVIDATAPNITGKDPDLQAASDTGISNTDNITKDNTPTFDVQCAEAGTTITLYIDGVALSEKKSCTTAGQKVVFTVPSVLADKTYSVTHTETDKAGNTSVMSSVESVTIDTSTTVPTIITLTDGAPVSGTAEAGATVVVTTPSGSTCTAVTNASGAWSCTLSPMPINGENITATATDIAGNSAYKNISGGLCFKNVYDAATYDSCNLYQ